MNSSIHIPVLLHEVLHALAVKPADVVVDGTTGGGGHSVGILQSVKFPIDLLCFDADATALAVASPLITEAAQSSQSKVRFFESNFRLISSVLAGAGVSKIDKAIFDLGLRSDQLATSGRGFSFLLDEPLVMTFAATTNDTTLTAKDIINNFEEADLANVFYGYGEERYSRRFARAIVEARQSKPITTTGELTSVIVQAAPHSYKKGRIHPATRIFQALRIAVNDELSALKDGLNGAWSLLAPGGRIAVISFHSLEDRIVKQYFQEKSKAGEGVLHVKKPLVPSAEEMAMNPRSRSAKLRIIEKVAAA